MKKTTLIIIVVLALLLTMLPAGIASAKPFSAIIAVRNQTGAPVTVTLQSAAKTSLYTFPVGAVDLKIAAGTYSYVTETKCGVKSTSVNLTRMAVLHFSCVKGEQVKSVRPINR